ncbi:MAG: uracil-DNA glycosylase [Legionellales bacterium]|nr:uracil-DNA glycosylase [Legionellales bacterium]
MPELIHHIHDFELNKVHPSWQPLVSQALTTMSPDYLQQLHRTQDWLPGLSHLFRAFSLDLQQVHYILFGESPYPRSQSANGYAFWDNAVTELWSASGLSVAVNRATSLRNFIKMLLIAQGYLSPENTSQAAIGNIDKSSLITTIQELFANLLNHGFLLLNASLVLRPAQVAQDAKAWLPFMESILQQLIAYRPRTQLILFGKIAEKIKSLPVANQFPQFIAEHPYNISFIHNQRVQQFFAALQLLARN